MRYTAGQQYSHAAPCAVNDALVVDTPQTTDGGMDTVGAVRSDITASSTADARPTGPPCPAPGLPSQTASSVAEQDGKARCSALTETGR